MALSCVRYGFGQRPSKALAVALFLATGKPPAGLAPGLRRCGASIPESTRPQSVSRHGRRWPDSPLRAGARHPWHLASSVTAPSTQIDQSSCLDAGSRNATLGHRQIFVCALPYKAHCALQPMTIKVKCCSRLFGAGPAEKVVAEMVSFRVKTGAWVLRASRTLARNETLSRRSIRKRRSRAPRGREYVSRLAHIGLNVGGGAHRRQW